jgi:hypothetical protein
MRTTVRLDDHLLTDVKKLAASQGMTLTAVLEQALREMLARQNQPEDEERLCLPTFKGCGLQPGVDLDDTAALLDLMSRNDDSR